MKHFKLENFYTPVIVMQNIICSSNKLTFIEVLFIIMELLLITVETKDLLFIIFLKYIHACIYRPNILYII